MIALVDYRAGNLTSVRKALAAVEAEVLTPEKPADLFDVEAIIVPGVGHFKATAVLDRGWRDAILRHVEAGRPLLGICLGLQWFFEGSEEAPDLPGLGLLPGRCMLLSGIGDQGSGIPHSRLKVPHVGWNSLEFVNGETPLLAGVPDGSHVYFTHSYAAPVTPAAVATTTYAERFASVVARDRIFGVQFHPEKSSTVGLAILQNFMSLVRESPDPRSLIPGANPATGSRSPAPGSRLQAAS